ncbi:MAG: hypothetical protein PHQ23_17145 [Candidatus Wallbacteria bacterium]|nr:hypothetical protein [Candidatus Wallbacteria bacterium]
MTNKLYLLILLMLAATVLSAEGLGVVNLGIVFNLHPTVIMYYSPASGTFMRP